MCDANNIDYFDDIFELMKGILIKLDEENANSYNVGNYVKRLIEQLRNTNDVIAEHVAKLLMYCKNIITNSCVKVNDVPYLTILLIATKDVYRQSKNDLAELAEEIGIVIKDDVSF
jgi:hypothetical protein